MSDHDDLGRALRDRAETIGPGEHPISFDDVKGRAHGIRRRRMAATGLAAAAVLAVAIPTGMVVADRATTRSDLPPAGTPTPQQTTSPSPSGTDESGDDTKVVTLDNNTDVVSPRPTIDYLVDGSIVSTREGVTELGLPNGDPASASRHYDSIARAGDAWLAHWRDEQGRSFVDFVKRGGIVFDTRRATDSLAESHDGSIAVYGTPGGDIVSFTPIDDNLVVTGPDAARPGANPVAVLGTGTCKEAEPEGGGCTVFFNDNGSDPAGYYATSHGISDQVAGLRSVGGVSKDGWVDGVVSADDFGSCSVMLDQDLREQWRTCDHTLGRFSPDGRLVVGYPAYRDGIGDSSVAIIDARTGKVLVEYERDRNAMAFVGTAAWDTDGTLLAPLFAHGSWSLVRMTSQGELTLVAGMQALGAEMEQVPVVLESRP
jgi:hypothetical protein